jgi:putative polyhydroxyalkanoic acid system protein
MHLEITHHLAKEEVIRRIDKAMEELQTQPLPAGVTLKDFTKAWTDNVLKVSFWAGKGFLGAAISLTVTVDETKVAIDLELPAMLKAFLPETQIEEGIKARVTPLLT